MFFVKIRNTLHPAAIVGKVADKDWDNRESKSITLEMDYATAAATFTDGVKWSIIQQDVVPAYDNNGVQSGTKTQETEFDNSDYTIAGDITDHRDGRVTVKMGRLTPLEEAYEIMLGGM